MKKTKIIVFSLEILIIAFIIFSPSFISKKKYLYNKINFDYSCLINIDKITENRVIEELDKNKHLFPDENDSFSSIQASLEELFINQKLHNSNTHTIYIQSLTIIQALLQKYDETNNKEYLEKAKEIFLIWKSLCNNFGDFFNYNWFDHVVSQRAIILAMLYDRIYDEKVEKEIEQIFDKSINILRNKNYYTVNHNHGLMCDYALLVLAAHLSDAKIRKNIIQESEIRFKKQVLSMSDSQGYHFENSPGYHFYFVNLISKYLQLYGNYGIMDEEIKIRYDKLEKNKSFFVTPENKIARMGDTDDNKVIYYKKDEGVILSQEAGYCIAKKFDDYFLLKTNSPINAHMQDDSSTFLLFFDGNSIISETGFLDYQAGKLNKEYNSRISHNVVLRLNEKKKNGKVRGSFEGFLNADSLVAVDIVLDNNFKRRVVFFVDKGILIVYDQNLTNDSFQNYIVKPQVKLDLLNNNMLELNSGEKKYYFSTVNNKIFVNPNFFPEGSFMIPYCKRVKIDRIVVKENNCESFTLISKDFLSVEKRSYFCDFTKSMKLDNVPLRKIEYFSNVRYWFNLIFGLKIFAVLIFLFGFYHFVFLRFLKKYLNDRIYSFMIYFSFLFVIIFYLLAKIKYLL